jgi:hypothetical protein
MPEIVGISGSSRLLESFRHNPVIEVDIFTILGLFLPNYFESIASWNQSYQTLCLFILGFLL